MKIASILHADHGISEDLLQAAINYINPSGFFATTVKLADIGSICEIKSALYGPVCGDAPVTDDEVFHLRRSEDRPLTRAIPAHRRPTDLLTVIGMVTEDGVKVFTAYGGPLAPREPGDVTLTAEKDIQEAKDFWAVHALASKE